MTKRMLTQDVNLGFGIHDSERHFPSRKQRVQLLVPKQAPPEERLHYCSKCNKRIEWLERPRKFICYNCGLGYHELYDTPLSSIDQQIKPLQSNDPHERTEPAIISFKPDKRLQGERINKHVTISGTMRKARIHVDGSPLLVTEELIRKELGEDAAYEY